MTLTLFTPTYGRSVSGLDGRCAASSFEYIQSVSLHSRGQTILDLSSTLDVMQTVEIVTHDWNGA